MATCNCSRLDRDCKKCRGDRHWFWTEEWQRGEREVDMYILEDIVQEYRTIEEFLELLRLPDHSPQ